MAATILRCNKALLHFLQMLIIMMINADVIDVHRYERNISVKIT